MSVISQEAVVAMLHSDIVKSTCDASTRSECLQSSLYVALDSNFMPIILTSMPSSLPSPLRLLRRNSATCGVSQPHGSLTHISYRIISNQIPVQQSA